MKGHPIFDIIISDQTSKIRRNEMTSANNLLKNLIGVKNIVITDCRTYDDSNGVRHLAIAARPDHWNANKCP